MSVLYSIDSALDVQFTKENVLFILHKCSELGFVFLTSEEDRDFFATSSPCLSIDQAAIKLLRITPEIVSDGGPFLDTKYQDTGFFFRLYEEDNRVGIRFGAFWFCWNKDFYCEDNVYTSIDFARYIRLMLEACKDLTLLEMCTYTDIIEDLVYTNKHCVTAAISFGPSQESCLKDVEAMKESIKCMIRNGIQNSFIFFNEKIDEAIEPSLQRMYDTLKAEFPAYLYVRINEIAFKIEIKKNQGYYNFISIYPLRPYLIKKGYGSEEGQIDLAFYVERLVELCDNFAIYGLKTLLK